MPTLDDPSTLSSLIDRLRSIQPDAERRWGTLSAHEMLCHLFDGHRFILELRDPSKPEPAVKSRPVLKWIALYSPLPWSKNAQTSASADPKRDGTQPADFRSDQDRAIESLRRVASAPPEKLAQVHPLFGPMSSRDWYHSVSRHVDHHLRQFGA